MAVLPGQSPVGKAGAKGAVHGNRGRPCKRKTQEKTIRRGCGIKYQGLNDFRRSPRSSSTHGVFQSIYSDRHSVFWTDREPTLDEQLINRKPIPS